MIDGPDSTKDVSQWKVVAGVLTYEGMIDISAIDSLCGKVISLFHYIPESGHFGALKTTELVSRDFYWPVMDSCVNKYVSSCKVCHWIKAPRYARPAINMSLETPSWPWEGIMTVFVTDVPESKASGYTGILVIVNQLTKMANYLPCRKDMHSPELARLFFEQVICKCGIPDNIVSDRRIQFRSRFWTQECSHLSTDHRLSPPCHPHTDGDTDHRNQTMEQYLQVFCNYQQDKWVELLRLGEFAYNNTVYASTRITPFWANTTSIQWCSWRPRSNHLACIRKSKQTLSQLAWRILTKLSVRTYRRFKPVKWNTPETKRLFLRLEI